ncbi:hypothetical protein MMC21_002675 [Puttea exsequens]|nr:hypothetical protein [Puttea exsequens]
MPSTAESFRIAHTARCKLSMAVDRPDRNFRFILGHALTLDKVMLRIAEIDSGSGSSGSSGSSSSDSDEGNMLPEEGRRVSFSVGSKARGVPMEDKIPGARGARRSPPPPRPAPDAEDGDEEEDDVAEDDEDDDGLSLERFPSASAQPPRAAAPSKDEIKAITAGQSDDGLVSMYNGIVRCPCNGDHAHAPRAEKMWSMPSKDMNGPRVAVVQVEA